MAFTFSSILQDVSLSMQLQFFFCKRNYSFYMQPLFPCFEESLPTPTPTPNPNKKQGFPSQRPTVPPC